jgi:hypothetical protein
VDIGLGEPSDEQLTTWTAMFLPRVLHDFAARLQVRDSAGATHPLVRNERVLFQSTRGPEATAPPRLAAWLLLAGLFVAGVIIWLASRAGRSRAARVALTIVASVWCVVAGLLGVVLTILWSATDHFFANENLSCSSAIGACGIVAVYFTTGRSARVTGYLAVGLAGLCVLALLSHLVMVSRQSNLADHPARASSGCDRWRCWLRRCVALDVTRQCTRSCRVSPYARHSSSRARSDYRWRRCCPGVAAAQAARPHPPTLTSPSRRSFSSLRALFLKHGHGPRQQLDELRFKPRSTTFSSR